MRFMDLAGLHDMAGPTDHAATLVGTPTQTSRGPTGQERGAGRAAFQAAAARCLLPAAGKAMACHPCRLSAVTMGLKLLCNHVFLLCIMPQACAISVCTTLVADLPPVTPCQQPCSHPSVHKHCEQEQLRCHDAMSLSRVKFFGETTIAVSARAQRRTLVPRTSRITAHNTT